MSMKLLLSIFISILLLWGCGGENKQTPEQQSEGTTTEEPKNDLESFAENMEKIKEGFTEGKKVEPVDFRELKALLPEKIGEMERTNASGEKTAAMGINISKANADYRMKEGNQRIDVDITDLGSVTGLAGFAAYGWYMVDIDRETDTGYEKTTTYNGHKAYEEYDNQNQSGKISVLVSKRFIVEVDGDNVSMDQIKTVLGMIDIGRLESMKDFGVEK